MRLFDYAWFVRWQWLLLLILDEPLLGRWFRWVLCLRPGDVGHRGRIVAIYPHAYVVENAHQTYTADFRTHGKFSKRMYDAFYPLWWVCHTWDTLIANPLRPAWNLGFDTLTQYPEADPATVACDGILRRQPGSPESFATITGGAFTVTDTASTPIRVLVRNAGTDLYDFRDVPVFLFDTSALGSDATISAAVLSYYGVIKNDMGSVTPDVDVYAATTASNTTLATSDAVGTTSQTGAPISYAGWVTSAYNDHTFNSTGRGNVNKTGVSKFGLRNANYDVAGVPPSNTEIDFRLYSADETGTANDPKLVVTFAGLPDRMADKVIGFTATKRTPGARINYGHWASRDLKSLLLMNEGGGQPFDLKRQMFTTAFSSNTLPTWQAASNLRFTLIGDSLQITDKETDLFTDAITVLWVRHKRDATNRTCQHWGIAPGGSADTLCYARVPDVDGTAYFRFGSTTISKTGLEFLAPELWAFTAGPLGRAMYRNGVLLASDTTPAARNVSSTPFTLNANAGIDGDLINVSFFAVYNVGWTIDQVQAWFADPYLMLVPQRAPTGSSLGSALLPEGAPTYLAVPPVNPVKWLEHHNEDPHAYAEVHLNDPASYHLGFKPPLIQSWDPIVRGRSNKHGQLEHMTWGVTLIDQVRNPVDAGPSGPIGPDRLIAEYVFRSQFESTSPTRYFPNRPCIAYAIDDPDRRRLRPPTVVAHGFVSEPGFISDSLFKMSFVDFLTRKYSRTRDAQTNWQPKISSLVFDPSRAKDLKGLPAPVCYGRFSKPTGAVWAKYVGQRYSSLTTTWFAEFLIAAHASKGNYHVFIDGVSKDAEIDTNILVPGTATWLATWGELHYLEVTGMRWTTVEVDLAYALAQDLVSDDELIAGGAKLQVNFDGIETIGDGTGEVIDNLYLQALHFAENAGVADRPFNAQPWYGVSPPEFSALPGVTYVHRSSFQAIAGLIDLPGTGIFGFGGEAVGFEDAFARMLVSGDFDAQFNAFDQLFATIEDTTSVTINEDQITLIKDDVHIIEGAFDVREAQEDFANILFYTYGQDFSGTNDSGWDSIPAGVTEVSDTPSQTNYDQQPPESFALYFLSANVDGLSGNALGIMNRKLARFRNPMPRVMLGLPSLIGASIEIGDYFRCSSIQGVGARGWVNKLLRCERSTLDLNTNVTMIEAYDIERIWA